LDMGPSILFHFGCFGLIMIGRVSLYDTHTQTRRKWQETSSIQILPPS
jgi:hypothetical protein